MRCAAACATVSPWHHGTHYTPRTIPRTPPLASHPSHPTPRTPPLASHHPSHPTSRIPPSHPTPHATRRIADTRTRVCCQIHAHGSFAANEIRRRLEANKPLTIGHVNVCLDAAVRGRTDHGPLPALIGPFFLYDLPRSPRELEMVERRFGAPPVALHFGPQRLDDETRRRADPGGDECAEILAARGTLLRLEEEEEVRICGPAPSVWGARVACGASCARV